MGNESVAKYLSVRSLLAVLILVIVTLCGTIITLKDSSISSQIDAKIKAAFECAKPASAEAVEKLDNKKLDVLVYVADQKAVEKQIEDIKRVVEKVDRNVDMLIRLQLQGKRAADLDRKAASEK